MVDRNGRDRTVRDERTLSVYDLLNGSVLGPRGQYLGYVFDVVVRPRSGRYPLVAGLLACLANFEVYLPALSLTRWERDVVRVDAAPDLLPLGRRDGLVRLRSDLLGRRFTAGSVRVRARDFLLRADPEGWVLTTVDARGRLARRTGSRGTGAMIDWLSLRTPVTVDDRVHT